MKKLLATLAPIILREEFAPDGEDDDADAEDSDAYKDQHLSVIDIS